MKFFLFTAFFTACVAAVRGDDLLPADFVSNVDTQTMNETRSVDDPLYQMCGVDFLGADVTSVKTTQPTACPSLCDQRYPKCILSTWTDYQDGTCWLKTLELDLKAVEPRANAASFVRLYQPTNPIAFAWRIHGETDMAGYDIGALAAGDMNQCLGHCYQNVRCFAVTWTNYNGGTCWLKSRASAFTTKSGAISAFVARKDAALGACPRV